MLIPMNIIEMATNAISGHNDGWTKKAAQKELLHITKHTEEKEIKEYIEKVLKVEK